MYPTTPSHANSKEIQKSPKLLLKYCQSNLLSHENKLSRMLSSKQLSNDSKISCLKIFCSGVTVLMLLFQVSLARHEFMLTIKHSLYK